MTKPDYMPRPVDRAARNAAAELLRSLANGTITNDRFEDDCPRTTDPAIEAIWDSAWCFYSDSREYRLTGRWRLDPETRRQVARWVLFLDSDLPYRWPRLSHPGIEPRWRVRQTWLGRALTLGSVSPKAAARFFETGHFPVWPFVTVGEYKAALHAPKRLNAQAA